MTAVRHFALGCCILCAAAGVIRIFWPDNQFKPVINTVLLLYILTSALNMGRGTDWSAFGAEVRSFETQASPSAAQEKSYTDYAVELGQESAVAGLSSLLEKQGVDAAVELQDGECKVTVKNAEDLATADTLLRANSGSLPYSITVEEAAK